MGGARLNVLGSRLDWNHLSTIAGITPVHTTVYFHSQQLIGPRQVKLELHICKTITICSHSVLKQYLDV